METVPRKVRRLDEISIKAGLERAALEFEADNENPVNSSVARELWVNAVKTILIVHGEAGWRAIILMRIFCLFSSKNLHFSVHSSAYAELVNASRILLEFGLVKSVNFYITFFYYPHIQVELMSLTMAEAIRKINLLNLPLHRRILEECFKCLYISCFEHSEKEYLEAWVQVLEYGDLYLQIREYSRSDIESHFGQVFRAIRIPDQNLSQQLPLFKKILTYYEARFGNADARTMQLKGIYMNFVFFSTILSDEEKWEQWVEQRKYFDSYFHSNEYFFRESDITSKIFDCLKSKVKIDPEIRKQFLYECVRLHERVISRLEESNDGGDGLLELRFRSNLIHSLCELEAITQLPELIRKFREKTRQLDHLEVDEAFDFIGKPSLHSLHPCFEIAVKESDSSVKHAVLEEFLKFLQLMIELTSNESYFILRVILLLMNTLTQLGKESEVTELLNNTRDLRFHLAEKITPRNDDDDAKMILKFHLEIELFRILRNRSS